ncbi:hypothetical protein ACHAPE_007998 [Trichoderma viride]
MSVFKNIATVGAGRLGSVVLDKLVSSGQFNVKVLKRMGSNSIINGNVKVVDVDFASVESLESALAGQEVVISTVASSALESQITLIDAAVAARVKHFIPSEYGSDINNSKTRQLPVFAPNVKVQKHLIAASELSGMTYTMVYSSAFLDYGLAYDFILKVSDYKPVLIDGGDLPFTVTTIPTVADAIIGVLKHSEETKNRAVYIEDLKVTQNKLFSLAKEVAPEKPWAPTYVKLEEMMAESDARLAQGKADWQTFKSYLYCATLDPAYGGNFSKTDNKLLGLPGKTEDDVKELLKELLA